MQIGLSHIICGRADDIDFALVILPLRLSGFLGLSGEDLCMQCIKLKDD